ncbi:MAG: DUF3857 domain-containing protein [Bacteroidetes bacterium]|nr:MAG: DUF3857 domain-containing protein [Bacteroidota bacterium]
MPSLQAGPIEDAWAAINQSKFDQARTILQAARKDKALFADATLMLIQINQMQWRDYNTTLMREFFEQTDISQPYLFTLWHNDAVTGGYQKFQRDNLEFVEALLKSPNVNSSLKVGAYYQLGLHYLLSADMAEARKTWNKAEVIRNWQMTGVFDNASGSGFDKAYEPITQAQPDARFISKYNADIRWITPPVEQADPWITSLNNIPASEGVMYFQTFVNSTAEQQVILALGISGAVKVWVNDQLLFAEKEELATEMDVFRFPAKLSKGYNRMLVQIGFTYKTKSPCFSLRVLDNAGNVVPGLSSNPLMQPYPKLTGDLRGKELPHFAESWFTRKIEEEPSDPMHYIHLAKYYLRNSQHSKAVETLKKAEVLFPDNTAVQFELLVAFTKTSNRTDLMKQLERLRGFSPQLPILVQYDFSQNLQNQDLTAAQEAIDIYKVQCGEDAEYYNMRIKLLAEKKDYEAVYQVVEQALGKFPSEDVFVRIQYYIRKNMTTSLSAIAGLRNFLRTNYSYSIRNLFWSELTESGSRIEAEGSMLDYLKDFPYDVDVMQTLVSRYYSEKRYDRALEWTQKTVEYQPFSSKNWLNLVYVLEAQREKSQALEAAAKAIHYNPNNFEAREKVRELSGKKPLLDFLRVPDAEERIKTALREELNSDEKYRYLFREASAVVFPEGSFLEYNVMAIQLLNQEGIDQWKESSFSTSSFQELTIDKSEIIKRNGQRLEAEVNGEELVFPSLEIGDVIFLEYRIENYASGSLRKEFWYDYTFNGFVPITDVSLKLYLPKGYKLGVNELNVGPRKQTELDDFDVYTWQVKNADKAKDEMYMPNLDEVGMSLAVSSVGSWRTISEWYRDLALPRAKEDYRVNDAFTAIFPQGHTQLSPKERAKAIYAYLCDNISYSSVSFRQSNHVPQEPGNTLSSRLGDCKDLSTLYHTLAGKAGLKTRLVLVSTRNNGENQLRMPSTNFNHCIIRIDFEDDTLYQELTDSRMAFGASPNSLINSQALVIPLTPQDAEGSDLIRIPRNPEVFSVLDRKATVKVEGTNTLSSTTLEVYGSAASSYRNSFSGLTAEDTRKTMLDFVSDFFDKEIKLKDYKLEGITDREALVKVGSDLEVKNEVISLGGIQAVKVRLYERIFSAKGFPEEPRQYPLTYWEYESIDEYKTQVEIELPAGKTFSEVPQNVSVRSFFIDYQLTYEKISDQKIRVTRHVKIDRNTIPADKYDAFREVVNQINQAEDIFLAFK